MKSTVLTLAACSLAISGAAFAQDYSASRTVQYLDADSSLDPVLAEIGASAADSEDIADAKRIVFANGLIAFAEFRVCENDDTDCRGMQLLASYGGPEGVSQAELMGRANRFNGKYNTAKAVVRDDGSVYYSRYIISDGGISMENLRVSMQVFENIRGQFETIVLDGEEVE